MTAPAPRRRSRSALTAVGSLAEVAGLGCIAAAAFLLSLPLGLLVLGLALLLIGVTLP